MSKVISASDMGKLSHQARLKKYGGKEGFKNWMKEISKRAAEKRTREAQERRV